MREDEDPTKAQLSFALIMSNGGTWLSSILLIGVPSHLFAAIFWSRRFAHPPHPKPLTALELMWLAGSLMLTFFVSLTAAAGLQAMMERTQRLWVVLMLELWLLFQLAVVGLFARLSLTDATGLNLGQTTLAAAYLLIWGLLVGYVAKIPWDRARSMLTKGLLHSYGFLDEARRRPTIDPAGFDGKSG